MFKSAATKIAHNTTIPALAGNSDLRPLQDLITAEKTVLVSLQKLRIDLAKAGDALRVWGQGEGDDLGDILTASSTMLTHFAAAISTYSSLHHTVCASMKFVQSRQKALVDLRRRHRDVGTSAEAAKKKLNKMSPEHKDFGVRTIDFNTREVEMAFMDKEIARQEAELGDYKRKCARDWMGFKFGGLVECCEKGIIVGDIGRQIIQSIPEDITQPGLPRVFYDAHGRVGDLVIQAKCAVSQVTFSANPPGRGPALIDISQSQSPSPTSQDPAAQTPFLPIPSLGNELTLSMGTYNPPPGPPPAVLQNRRSSVDELGVHTPTAYASPQFSSLPASRERDPTPASPSVGRSSWSEPHGPVTNARAGPSPFIPEVELVEGEEGEEAQRGNLPESDAQFVITVDDGETGAGAFRANESDGVREERDVVRAPPPYAGPGILQEDDHNPWP